MIRKIFVFILQCVFIVFLCFLARGAWLGYQEVKQDATFASEGQLVEVPVVEVTHEKKTWKDFIGNSKYLSIHYHQKNYVVRYLADSGWVGAGDHVTLIYLAATDAFRQPPHKYPQHNYQSKLIHWTFIGTFSLAHKWLFAALALSLIAIIFILSMLARLTDATLLVRLSNWLVIACFVGAGIFFSWDTWRYYQYYQALKENAVVQTVLLVDKGKVVFPSNDTDAWVDYDYYAVVEFDKERREISISSQDYTNWKAGDRVPVLYNAGMNDMMSPNFSLKYWKALLLIIMWVVIYYIVRKKS